MLNIMSKKKNLLRSGFSLSILTMGSRILGLIREMTKATFLGTSDLADAFTFAFQLPNLFRRLFAENAISVAFIPTFRNKLEEETAKNPDLDYSQLIETRQFLNSTLTVVTFLTTLVSALGMILIPFIAPFFTKSSDPIFLGEMSTLTRIMFPYLIFISVAAFFQGILNGVNIFSPSGFTPILFNLIVITCTYAFAGKTANPARAMAYGVIFGGVVQAAFQLPFVLKQGFRFSLTGLKKAFTNPNTKTVMRLIVPTLFGMAAYQLNDLVSMAVAGNAGSGIQSSLQYSLRLQELILGIFAVTIGTIILPDLTSYAKNKDFTQFNGLLKNAIRIIYYNSNNIFCLCNRRKHNPLSFPKQKFFRRICSSCKTSLSISHCGTFLYCPKQNSFPSLLRPKQHKISNHCRHYRFWSKHYFSNSPSPSF